MTDGEAAGGASESATADDPAADASPADAPTPDSDDAPTADPDDGTPAREPYRGLFGAFVYAPRASESRAFRAYAVLAALAGLGLTFVFGIALIVWIAASVGLSPLVTLSRAFLVVVWLFVLAPIVAPVLLVARRHRRGRGDVGYDARLAGAGVLYLLSLYVGVVITVPPAAQEPVGGLFGPVVEVLYSLPQVAGVIPPLLAVALLVAVHRLSG